MAEGDGLLIQNSNFLHFKEFREVSQRNVILRGEKAIPKNKTGEVSRCIELSFLGHHVLKFVLNFPDR